MSPAQIAQRLRQRRSPRYVEAVARLDAGSHQHNPAVLHALLEAITAEFSELGIEERPLGLLARCRLGAPYDVHICDLGGNILEHYERWRSLPPLFERGRVLAGHGAYAFLEIYPSSLRVVSADGTVATLDQ